MFNRQLIFILFVLLTMPYLAQSNQNLKLIKTTRITQTPKIDGDLNDEAWKNAEVATDFVVLRPANGKVVDKNYQTTVKVVYNDDAIYISAEMNDPNPEKIPREFAVRDNFSISDFFLVTINPNDGQNPFEFIVQATDNQADAKVSNGREDFNWSAVWASASRITDAGWVVEMEIPYRALRFANQTVQSWGFNFHRRLELLNEQHTWNHIDNTVGRWTQYDGLITDLREIKPTTRLNLYPYQSSITRTFQGKTDFDWAVGMDIKYGLTENFTLDATLIPELVKFLVPFLVFSSLRFSKMITGKNLHKSFGDIEVLKGVNIDVKKGEIVAIVGPSGAGKTTLLQILGTLDKPDSSSTYDLNINNIEIKNLSDSQISKFRNEQVGFIFQFHQLLPEFTALENVCIPAFIGKKSKKEAETKAKEVLDYLGLSDRYHHKPNELSGGEQQRVAVARALINNPAVILADEPSGNLDSQSAENLHDLFFKLRDEFNQTFVIVTHNETLADMADRKLVMKDGIIL